MGEHQVNPPVVPGVHDLRHQLQKNQGSAQGMPPPYVAPPRDNCMGGAEIFDAFGRIISPLSDEILNTPMSERYKFLNITPYNGIGNPSNFLSQFKYSMLNQNLGNIYMCKLFAELLVDNARQWFDSLPAGSIRSYNELMDAFSRSLSQRTEVNHTPAHLLTMKQNKGESIQDFVTRFDRECLQTRGLNDLLVISAFQNAITSDALYREILAKDPQTITELWAIADKFAKIDEATRRRREGDRGDASDKKKKEEAPRMTVMDRIQRVHLESCL